MSRMPPIAIPVAAEGFELRGALDGPDGASGLLLCHPHPAFGGTMETPLVVSLAGAAAAAGLCVLRFNFRGIGGSGGRAEGGLAEHRDVAAAAAWLRAATKRPVAIAGYSFGALMAARAIAAGEPATRFAAVALPTSLVDGQAQRLADVRTAFAAQPTLLVAGTSDRLCNTSMLRAWSLGAPAVTLAELPGAGHFPTGEALQSLIARVVGFMRA